MAVVYRAFDIHLGYKVAVKIIRTKPIIPSKISHSLLCFEREAKKVAKLDHSALAEIPIDQQKAITGSVNQHGQIQAIGGVNEKIEGFFAVCRQAGLTGEQGVIIPHANQRSLMLEEEVIAAVREGKFHIWTVNTIDEAIELMTGYRAGERKKDGTFPAGSFNHAVQEQLTRFARVITAGRRKPATPKQTNRARSRTTG